jgi:hypothetical protein
MRSSIVMIAWFGLFSASPVRSEPLPFNHKVEVYRDKDSTAVVFSLRLEQPFLAEEFEKSNYLRLETLDRNAYLVYPKETRFSQKHAEFYGRLRGQGKAQLRLAYEIVSENADGSRKVDVRHGDIDIAIPAEPVGPRGIYHEWARQQNAYFLSLLKYYPDETFFQYALLQSRDRHHVEPPDLPKPDPDRASVETGLYHVLSGSLAIQESLQHQTLKTGPRVGDLNVPISALSPPPLQSLDYARLLEEKRTKHHVLPRTHDIAQLVPEDQYFLHFHSLRSAGDLFDLSKNWGDSLLRLWTVHAQDNRLQEKLEDQLCLRRDPLTQLFADGALAEVAITGSDPFFLEGTDFTVLLRLKQPQLFQAAAGNWVAQVRRKYPEMVEREFHYKGHRVLARYTSDRVVSSFVTTSGDYVLYSNSHSAIRKVIDVATGNFPRLSRAADYQYATTVLPPSTAPNTGYLFASEAFVKRLIGPSAKIAEKRRMQCFNNLVMLNNASLLYRLEEGKSPTSLTDLIQGRFVDPSRVICPHGGAYAFDPRHDTCTCSLHNRLKYLTPNAELPVLTVSGDEQQEYDRYKQRYAAFWQTVFDPLAVRITVAPRVKLEVCVLPFANGSLYQNVRESLDSQAQPIDIARVAPSALTSLVAVYGRKNIAGLLRSVPGIPEVLEADPTLTDLSWIGDRIGIHLCDGSTILEIDPLGLRSLDLPFGKAPVLPQAMAAAALSATELPAYISIDIQDKDKAARLLEQLAAKIFLQRGKILGLPSAVDAYRLPDYHQHARYVLSYQVYTVKVRLHVALVGQQLIAATRPEVLEEVIDAAGRPESREPPRAHLLLRWNRQALKKLEDDLQLYWAEKSRLACHRNIISIYNLVKLYDVPVAETSRLAEAKYGVRYFCPDHGVYEWDARRDQVTCSVHGNRQESRQNPRLDRRSSFQEFMDSLTEVVATLRFQDEALIATVEIERKPWPGK